MGREAADCETCESGENGLWPAVAVEAALPVRVIAGAVTADAGVPALDGGEKRNFGPGRLECVSVLLGSAGGRAGRERCWTAMIGGTGRDGADADADDSSSSPSASSTDALLRTPTRNVTSNSFSTGTSFARSDTIRSNSHTGAAGSSVLSGLVPLAAGRGLLSRDPGVGGAAVRVRVGAMGATGIRRFNVDVCNRPGSCARPDRHVKSNLPRGRIVPGA